MRSSILHEPDVPMPVDTVMPDTFESCRDAMMCGNDCDFLNGLYSLDVIDIMHSLVGSVVASSLRAYSYFPIFSPFSSSFSHSCYFAINSIITFSHPQYCACYYSVAYNMASRCESMRVRTVCVAWNNLFFTLSRHSPLLTDSQSVSQTHFISTPE